MIKLNFEDCPYKCNNGKIFDYRLKKEIICPHCGDKRETLAKEGLVEDDLGQLQSLPRVLGIDNKYLQTRLVYDTVIPEGERVFLEDESVENQKEVIEDIYLGLSIGQLPSRSYCIGLGNKGRVDRLAYPLLAKAYISGVSVARFISCSEYNRLYINMSDEVEDFLDKDLVLVLIPDGASKADILSAKGLMQSRALKGKCTIFITTWVIEACSILLGFKEDESCFLATEVFVRYKSSKGKKSSYINRLTGVENGVYFEDNENRPSAGGNVTTINSLLDS